MGEQFSCSYIALFFKQYVHDACFLQSEVQVRWITRKLIRDVQRPKLWNYAKWHMYYLKIRFPLTQ